MKPYSQEEVAAAERALVRRRADLERTRAWAESLPLVPGCQRPGKWEIEQAEAAVYTAEATLARAKRRPAAGQKE